LEVRLLASSVGIALASFFPNGHGILLDEEATTYGS